MGEFPRGQRGQTVNLLRFVSMVRIRPPPPIKLNFKICWHGSTVEQLTCNQQVVGSIPIASSINGGVPERPKGADCKSVTFRFDGSNPSSPTIYDLI